MFATKLKLAVAAVLATCALGFGTLSASGGGTQPGAKAAPTGGGTGAPPAAKAKPAATDAELLQGRWRGVSRVHDDKPTPVPTTAQGEVEFRGTTMVFPALEGEGSPRNSGFKFELGASDGLRTIDVTAQGKPTARGIYEFTLPSTACAKCHSGTPDKGVNAAPACAPALLALASKGSYGLRVALTTDGPRPQTFGGKGVVVTELVRVPAEEAAGLDDLQRQREKRAQLEAERAAREDVARERDRLRALAEQLEWLAQQKETAVEAKKLRVEMEALSAKLDNAAERLRVSQRKVIGAREELAQAESTLAQSFADYRVLQAQLEALQKKAEGAKSTPNAVAAGAFTVHVRTLTAAEKVYKVKATGNQTILEAIVYAADDVSVKSDAVSVWVVRGKEVLTVDLPAILKNGETKTNYALKADDRVFVQAKPAK